LADEIYKIVMTEKKEQLIPTVQVANNNDELRFLPFAVAGLICFTIAVILGTGSWLFFGSHTRKKGDITAGLNYPSNISNEKEATAKTETSPSLIVAAESPTTPVESETTAKTSIENVVEVAGGEIAIGGGDTQKPLERVIVKNFSISETEVTNAQYSEFIKATNHAAPPGWKVSEFPKGTENYPVTNVNWQDALAYCKWMEKKIGLPVRLPTEAEWELAARGTESNKYPWGNKWNDEAAGSKENGGNISPVRSFPLNRSPFGAFDMAGNVWEWTQDKVGKSEGVSDEKVKEALDNGQVLRIVKGGSSKEKAAQISARARYEIPENTKAPSVGFRYVVEQKQNP
jgi:formylglycine-generating enzyme required for sulfatase activity